MREFIHMPVAIAASITTTKATFAIATTMGAMA
jgi:hypothetical protein